MEMIDKAGRNPSTVRIHTDLIQGTEEWITTRCGMLTASEMKLIVTPTFKAASNEKERAHLYELLAQRITGYVEPHYVSDDMMRGHDDEVEAVELYDRHVARVERVGFITNNKWGFTLGYSPDALVGDLGQIEVKSRRQKYQVETFLIHVLDQTSPSAFLIQVQSGLAISERGFCDFISYSGGLPMAVIRVHPDPKIQDAIISAASDFERRLSENLERYRAAIVGALPTVRRIEGDIQA